MKIVITGGAGFIGVNLARHFLAQDCQVVVFDSCVRPGSENNLQGLRRSFDRGLRCVAGDVRNYEQVREAVQGADAVLHLAGQVAVTTSVADPALDFQVNALGTLNVLEALRKHNPSATLIYTSTNKVYGGLGDVALSEGQLRYDAPELPHGINEDRPLDFHSPYGCSKGAADQYVLDYARIYGLKTVVFRMSCIYGPFQNGNEDQGWVAHFARSAMRGEGLKIYGDGKQVRDVLHVRDLVRVFELALKQTSVCPGRPYNLGGGIDNSVSLLQLIQLLQEQTGEEIPVTFLDWRPGDQRWYVSDVRRAMHNFHWKPETGPHEGLQDLIGWVASVI